MAHGQTVVELGIPEVGPLGLQRERSLRYGLDRRIEDGQAEPSDFQEAGEELSL